MGEEIQVAQGTGVYFNPRDILRIEKTGELIEVKNIRMDRVEWRRVTRLRWAYLRACYRVARTWRYVRWQVRDRWRPEADLDRWDWDDD